MLVSALIWSLIVGAALSLVVFKAGVRLAHRFGILDSPTIRKRHRAPIPIIGGACIFASWLGAIAVYAALDPSWLDMYFRSLLVTTVCMGSLVIMGLVDDTRGLSPRVKLCIEALAAVGMMVFEPQINALLVHWQASLGPVVWAIALLWVVGITNSMNLIDGIDGLAGGTAFLVLTSLMLLNILGGADASFGVVTIPLVIPPILNFLRYNWNPAKMFLGDNGSLTLGFFVATSSLMCRPLNKSWIMLATMVLMLGYPILDTTLAAWRRVRKGLPMFKADRNHLHHRVLRLGLSVGATSALLLSITLYLQVTSLCINLIRSPITATFAITVVLFSVCSLIFMIRSIERWKVNRLFQAFKRNSVDMDDNARTEMLTVVNVDLEPLLEAGMSEEQGRYRQLLAALQLMLKSHIRGEDMIVMTREQISILLINFEGDEAVEQAVVQRFSQRLEQFLALYNLQCSLSSLPVSIEKRPLIVSRGGAKAAAGEDAQKIAS